MPIAKIQLEDGRIARFEVPEGTTEEQVIEFARSQSFDKPDSGGFDKATGTINAFGQGASFGFADELYGLTQAALPYPLGLARGDGQTFGDLYSEAANDYRNKQDIYAKENPVLSMGAELIGGLTTGIGGGGKVAGTRIGTALANKTAHMNRMLKYGGAGGVAGAVAGAGYAPEGDTLSGALMGGGLGTTLGVVAPPVIDGVGKVAGALTAPVKALVNSQMSPDVAASKKLIEALRRDDLSPDDARAILDDMGVDATLADVAGENTLGLVEAVTTQAGQGKNQLIKQLTERQMGSGKRIEDIVSQEISGKPANIKVLKQLDADRKTQVAPLYQKAYEAEVPFTPELKGLLGKGIVNKAMRAAMEMAEDEGDAVVQKLFMDKDGVMELVDTPSFRSLDYIKRGLDDIIEKETSDLGRLSSRGRLALQTKNELLAQMDNASPDYKQARQIYSDSYSNERAMQSGRKFFNTDYDIIEDQLASMSQTEKDFFKMGVARALQDKLRNRATTGDKTRLFNKESVWDKLKPVFDDDAALERFIKKLEAEEKKSLTYTRATGNSRTAARQAVQDDMDAPELNTGRTALDFLVNALKGDRRKVAEPMMDSLAKALLSTDRAEVDRMLMLMGRQQPRPPILPPYAPTSGAVVGGEAVGSTARTQ